MISNKGCNIPVVVTSVGVGAEMDTSFRSMELTSALTSHVVGTSLVKDAVVLL